MVTSLCIPFFIACVLSIPVSQGSWSTGPGFPGPTPNWLQHFSESDSINWYGSETLIYLEAQSSKQFICDASEIVETIHTWDVDQDGDVDLLIDGNANENCWYANPGNNDEWTKVMVDSQGTSWVSSFSMDVNNDSYTDIVRILSTSSCDSIFWYMNVDGSGYAWIKRFIGTTENAACCYGGDFNGDGLLDIAIGGNQDPPIRWWENCYQSSFEWISHELPVASLYRCDDIGCEDLDGDGDVDIITASYEPTSGITVFSNLDGTGTLWQPYHPGIPVDGAPIALDIADFNQDSIQDVVFAATNAPYTGGIFWLEFSEGPFPNWTSRVMEDDFPGARSIAAVDATGDAYPDVICSNGYTSSDYEVRLMINAGGPGTWWVEHNISNSWCYAVEGADITGDSAEELLFGTFSGSLYWAQISTCEEGVLISSIRDMIGYPQWYSIDWECCEPAGTDIYFRVRGSNDPENMGEWSANIQIPGDVSVYLDSAYRYIQYSAFLESEHAPSTPVLDEITLEYGNMGMEEGTADRIVMLPVTPNPSGRSAAISFITTETGIVELAVFDLAGRRVFFSSEEWTSGRHALNIPFLPPGTYIARLCTGGVEKLTRFVVLNP